MAFSKFLLASASLPRLWWAMARFRCASANSPLLGKGAGIELHRLLMVLGFLLEQAGVE